MIRRAPAAVALLALAWLGVAANPASAQAADSVRSGPVVVDLSGQIDPPPDEGVLVRTDSTTLAPMMSVYIGLSLVGATLALITIRRRNGGPTADARFTGVVPGRRSRGEFWGLPVAAREGPSARPGDKPGRRPGARSGPPILVGSGETASSITEHRPPVRAGYARGANDG
jgi:hypothetical protein